MLGTIIIIVYFSIGLSSSILHYWSSKKVLNNPDRYLSELNRNQQATFNLIIDEFKLIHSSFFRSFRYYIILTVLYPVVIVINLRNIL